ncbi:MAG: hypothetical protein HY886_04080 [Deltaproteobacteria bacterium]|nr:hypothetical protein [Deltaproteobacteria bacterium]
MSRNIYDKAKVENVKWFSRFTLLERIRIARKNMQRARKLRGLALPPSLKEATKK